MRYDKIICLNCGKNDFEIEPVVTGVKNLYCKECGNAWAISDKVVRQGISIAEFAVLIAAVSIAAIVIFTVILS